ncbi:CDP-abequose synthase [Clostridia bacterium]|nr:CDP-abequose synthase [Clostridia bacterium]
MRDWIQIKRAIVTGASGFIGSELVRLLVQDGIQVLAVVRPGSLKKNRLVQSSLVRVCECDINHIRSLCHMGLTERFDVFFHFAWQGVYGPARDDVFLQSADMINTLAAIQTAKDLGCEKFVGAGSQAEFGLMSVGEKISCRTPSRPLTPYGVAKAASRQLGSILAARLEIGFNWGAILSAYGPGDSPRTMVMDIAHKMLAGKKCDLSSGEQIWDYIYSTDAARAFYAIAAKGVNGKTYPVGTGEGRPLKSYIFDMYDVIGNGESKLNFGGIPLSDGAIRYLCADIAEFTADTGFRPEIPFKEGIRTVAESLKRVER